MRKTYRYAFRVDFRTGGSVETYAVTTSEAQARRDCWAGLEAMHREPRRIVRRIELLSKTPETLSGLDAIR